MKLPARKAPSLKRTSKQVLPTPESPTSITCEGGREERVRHHFQPLHSNFPSPSQKPHPGGKQQILIPDGEPQPKVTAQNPGGGQGAAASAVLQQQAPAQRHHLCSLSCVHPLSRTSTAPRPPLILSNAEGAAPGAACPPSACPATGNQGKAETIP